MSEQSSDMQEEKKDRSVWVRRLINIVISLAIGFAGTYLSVHYILNTVMDDYGTVYIVMTILSIACAVGVWLDHERLLNSKILPH